MVLCVAGHRTLDRIGYRALASDGRLAGKEVRDPLDARAGGVVPAEGACVLLLKRLADGAARDGDPIRGILHAVEGGCAPTMAEAVGRAARASWRSAGVGPEQAVVAELPGLGDQRQDREALESLAEVFAGGRRNGPALIGSTTAQLGHIGGAAGMAAAIKTLLAIDRLRMPRTAGLAEPCSVFETFRHAVRATPAEAPIAAATDSGRVFASVIDRDPRGQAYSIVLERAAPAPVEEESRPRRRKQVVVQASRFAVQASRLHRAAGTAAPQARPGRTRLQPLTPPSSGAKK